MSTTDVSGIRSGGRVETERKDKSADTSSSPVDNASRAVSDAVEFSAAAQQLSSLKEELASLDLSTWEKSMRSARLSLTEATK